jgi:hypothetical protein
MRVAAREQRHDMPPLRGHHQLLAISHFNQDIGAWDIGNVTRMYSMFDNSGMSIENYDATIIGWANQAATTGVQQNVHIEAAGLHYSAESEEARQTLIDDFSWRFVGDEYGTGHFIVGTNDNDIFVGGAGDDVVTDFNAHEDRIVLFGALTGTSQIDGDDAIITYGNGATVVLQDVFLSVEAESAEWLDITEINNDVIV